MFSTPLRDGSEIRDRSSTKNATPYSMRMSERVQNSEAPGVRDARFDFAPKQFTDGNIRPRQSRFNSDDMPDADDRIEAVEEYDVSFEAEAMNLLDILCKRETITATYTQPQRQLENITMQQNQSKETVTDPISACSKISSAIINPELE